MIPHKEIIIGFILWLTGASGCILTAFYVTKNEGVLYLFFGSILAIGFILIWCGVFDIVCDDFEGEIKDSYNN